MGSTVTYTRPDGQSASGYLAEPAQPAGAPAVVVIQEWWGLNDQIRGVADRLASAGYVALVPDLYKGRSTVEAEEAHHLMDGLNFGEAAAQDIRGAVQHLKGTRWLGRTQGRRHRLLHGRRADAAGAVPRARGRRRRGLVRLPAAGVHRRVEIRVPVMGHFATQDQFFGIATIDALEAKLAEAGVAFESHRYLAHHGFANETAVGPGRIPATQYDPVWAQQAWDRTLRFFGRTLG